MAAPAFRHIPQGVAQRYLDFAASHPDIVPRHALLQKLVIFDFVAPVVAARPHASILEIGSGLGIHSALLSRYGAVSATELAVPGSFVGAEGNVTEARSAVLRDLSERPVACSTHDGRRLPYEDGSFDIVFHNSVIEHVPDVAAFNREVHRVLRPGGFCICITGTPALCRLRLVRDWLLLLPLHAGIAVIREIPLLRELVIGMLRVIGASDSMRQKVRERLQRVDDRVRAISGSTPAPSEMPFPGKSLASLYPRLFHVIYFPDYNRIVLEELAREAAIAPEALLACLERHFASLPNRLRFSLTPRTHGQHYRNALHEMKEWRIARWRRQFEQADFDIEDIIGYRYHHIFELTPVPAWNSAFYARAAQCIHAAVDRKLADPACASEVIFVAKRKG